MCLCVHVNKQTISFGEHYNYLKSSMGFPGGSAGKESTCIMRDLGLIPGLGRSPGGGNNYPLQYSGLENSGDCAVHGIAHSLIILSNFHAHFTLAFGKLTVK